MVFDLKKNYYPILEKQLQELPFEAQFARSVLQGHMNGRVFTDSNTKPGSFYIVTDYGMSLLFGNAASEKFNQELHEYFSNNSSREKDEWLQAYPPVWSAVLAPMLKMRTAEQYTRQNFKFSPENYKKWKDSKEIEEITTKPTPKKVYYASEGSVISKYFWADINLYEQYCISYSAVYENELASTAFAACRNIAGKQLEIGIETKEAYRKKGFATAACSALIDYCMQNNLEPVWSCRGENAGSHRLAKKLGFMESLSLPYYFIPKQ